MPSGRAGSLDELPASLKGLLDSVRRAVMSTVDADGSLHAVPIVFAAVRDEIVSPIDHKPKSGKTLARVKNLRRDDRLTLLLDHWDEDWTNLAWLMVRGRGVIDPAPPVGLVRAINARYPQYANDEAHDALIRIRPSRLSWWTWS
jgi:PPOX class probable F420-dependent enzyme